MQTNFANILWKFRIKTLTRFREIAVFVGERF